MLCDINSPHTRDVAPCNEHVEEYIKPWRLQKLMLGDVKSHMFVRWNVLFVFWKPLNEEYIAVMK